MLKYLVLWAIASQVLVEGIFPGPWDEIDAKIKAQKTPNPRPRSFAAGMDKMPGELTMGTSGVAIGGFNKRIGLAQANVAKYVKAAEDEVEANLNFLKSTVAALRATPCGPVGYIDSVEADIKSQLKTAFEPCKMEDELAQLRMQGAQGKRQIAMNKMAQRRCYANPDPTACATATDNEGLDTGNRMIDELKPKFFACLRKTKEDLFLQIEDAYERLLYC